MKTVKLEWRESHSLSGSMAYSADLVVFPGQVYEFSENEAAQALKDFPSNFFLVTESVEQKVKKEIKSKKDKSLKEEKTETKTK